MKYFDLCDRVEDRQLGDFRYNAFVEKNLRHRNSAVKLLSLRLTKDAAKQHILRIYHQIQERLGLHLRPEKYGWTFRNFKYEPVHRLRPSNQLSSYSEKSEIIM